MRRTNCLIAAISFSSVLFGVPLLLPAQDFETQTFDSEISAEAAGWTGNMNRDDGLGTDFGFSATDNAGGSSGAGEAGGLFPRLQTPVAFYGDTDLGGELTLDDVLAATGKFMISNLDFDGEIWLGWFDATDSPNRTDFLGLHFREPNDATRPDFRGLASYYLADGTNDVGDFVAVPEDELFEFALIYDPLGGFGGVGELEVIMTNRDTGDVINIVNELNDADRLEGAEFNAFGFTTSGGAGSNVPTRLAELYIDDLTYTSLDSSFPGDFDGDGAYTCDDINTLYAGIASGDSSVDLTGDGAVDDADVDAWREEAGTAKGFSTAVLLGDADLSGVVNATDLNEIALNWQRTDATSWCEGDFNHDGNVNAPDLNDLALNWLSDIRPAGAAAAVPEPASFGLCWMALLAVLGRLRTRS